MGQKVGSGFEFVRGVIGYEIRMRRCIFGSSFRSG